MSDASTFLQVKMSERFREFGRSTVIYSTNPRYACSFQPNKGSYQLGAYGQPKQQPKISTIQLKAQNQTSKLIPHTALLGIDKFTRGNMCHTIFDHFERYYSAQVCGIQFDYFLACDTTWGWTKTVIQNILQWHEKVLYLKPDHFYDVYNLISYGDNLSPNHPAYNCDPGYLTFLRRKFHKYIEQRIIKTDLSKNTNKIFISRKSIYRRPDNLNDIEELFRQNNFKVVYFEELSFDDQLISCYTASHIAGLHGAGLTNIIACKQETKILEIFTNGGTNAYELISKAVKNPYECCGHQRESEVLRTSLGTINAKLKKFAD